MKKVKEKAVKIKKGKWGTVITVLLGLWLAAFAVSYLLSGKVIAPVGDNKLVFIPIHGFISSDGSSGIPFGSETTTSTQVIDYLAEAGKDDKIKGVILEINSAGGTVVATREIETAVKQLKKKKPVVAWVRDVGASGGYWIASAADKIVVDPMSITGSIGVTSSYLEFSGLMEKYGIGYEELKAGKYKESGSPFRKLTDEEKRILQSKLSIIQAHFVNTVSENRNLPKDKVMGLATGMYYLGQEAYETGLVDYLGGKDLAINITQELAGIEDAKLVKFEKKKRLFDILSRFSANAFYYLGRGISAELQSQAKVSTSLEIIV